MFLYYFAVFPFSWIFCWCFFCVFLLGFSLICLCFLLLSLLLKLSFTLSIFCSFSGISFWFPVMLPVFVFGLQLELSIDIETAGTIDSDCCYPNTNLRTNMTCDIILFIQKYGSSLNYEGLIYLIYLDMYRFIQMSNLKQKLSYIICI